MSIRPGRQATLGQGRFTTLHTVILGACKVTLTGASGEFTTIPFRIKRNRFAGRPFDAAEASIPRGQGLGLKSIQATTPEGVGTLDIVYELRTGADAS
jgi:hypothetical protein